MSSEQELNFIKEIEEERRDNIAFQRNSTNDYFAITAGYCDRLFREKGESEDEK